MFEAVFFTIMGVLLIVGFFCERLLQKLIDARAELEHPVIGSWTDPATGCQYLTNAKGHIHPRLTPEGRQVVITPDLVARAKQALNDDRTHLPDTPHFDTVEDMIRNFSTDGKKPH